MSVNNVDTLLTDYFKTAFSYENARRDRKLTEFWNIAHFTHFKK